MSGQLHVTSLAREPSEPPNSGGPEPRGGTHARLQHDERDASPELWLRHVVELVGALTARRCPHVFAHDLAHGRHHLVVKVSLALRLCVPDVHDPEDAGLLVESGVVQDEAVGCSRRSL